jgi:enoyl-CoA hydratase
MSAATERSDEPAVTISHAAGGVFVIRMTNPPVNALAPHLLVALNEALDSAQAEDARVVVLSSAVNRFFAAGADLKTMVDADAEQFASYGLAVRSTVQRIADHDRPVVAAIEGSALGGGMELALACTLRVAALGSRLGLPEARIGLIPSAGATQRLPRYVGRGRALELMLTGRSLTVEEAHALGLVDRVVEAGHAEESAIGLAAELAHLSIPALMSMVRLVDTSFETAMTDGLRQEVVEVEALVAGPDAREGMRAFLEKRAPRFE